MEEQIGRYKILSEIGEGAMAKVYKAYDPGIDRTLALKILKPESCQNPDVLSRFMREARAAGALNHANIVTVFDVGQTENRPYIVMELLEGETLEQVLEDDQRLVPEKILSIGIQLANALHYAHENGIVHRDIKPSNILLSSADNAVKIADFGIARVSDPDRTEQTQVGMMLGTPRYMSPEQVKGEPVDRRSDLFSVGVLLYQLLTGEKPFRGSTMATLVKEITDGTVPPLRSIDPTLPIGLQTIVSKLLNKSPDRRFQTGADLARALTRERQSMIEEGDLDRGNKYIPLKLKWTALMALIIVVTMSISSYLIYQRQIESMTDQLADFGSALSRFIARESAVNVLQEDWTAIEVLVDDIQERESFAYLTVTDRNGIVRAASDRDLLGSPYTPLANMMPLQTNHKAVDISTVQLSGGMTALNFTSPIVFKQTELGLVHLGLSRESLENVARTSLILIVTLAVVGIVAIVVVTYVLGALLARPIRKLRISMGEIAKGHFDTRIPENRNDEFGDLFRAFNRMASELSETSDAKNSDDIDETQTPDSPDAQDDEATIITPSPQKSS
jgi:serine/threonine-protein kinase